VDAPTPLWFTSSYSSASGNGCVEVAFLADGSVGVRDTKDRTRRSLAVSPAAWGDFLAATRSGRFTIG
jgi:hypothetical protein